MAPPDRIVCEVEKSAVFKVGVVAEPQKPSLSLTSLGWGELFG